MNRRYVLIGVAALIALLAVGAGAVAVARESPENEGSLRAPNVSLGEPGLSFRYVGTFGVTEMAYLADAQHLNRPNGLFIDGSDNLYVVEEFGARMLKYRTSDGANLLSIGVAGLNIAGDDTFYHPQDVAVDNTGNIWALDGHRAVQYDSSGAYQQQVGDWWEGDDETHFTEPLGVAFDGAGRMYISDRWNHRVQVYTFVGGTPVYSTTIGVTGVYGDDNAHFNQPTQILIDSSDRLYVADANNFRVQRCTYAAGWICTTFHGTGSQGSGANELSWADGLGIDGSDNVYIADGGNARVKKCDSGGSCSTFASGFDWPADVAVDSSGNVYVSDWNECTIREYNSSGVFQGRFVGASDVPYLTDNNHFNAPYGVAVDGSGNIYLSTNRGYRVLKLNASGIAQWAVGTAGVWGSDNVHFGAYWEGPNNVAVDTSGNVYVADTGNHRIQIYDSSGSYVTTLGSYGSDNDQFDGPRGVAVDGSGNIYVADSGNHRVQVYNSSRVYQATLGVTGVSGSDNSHFDHPNGVTVDASGNIYVADTDNHRVQVFNSSRVHQRTIGTTGASGDDFDHFAPHDVAVDASGRIYVADRWNNRVQVFDSSGAYLTTIGGAWGSNTGQLRGPPSVEVDAQGNVYITDWDNHRIQKFAPGVPGWEQSNINGFGYRTGYLVGALAPFGGQLYAGMYNPDTGAQLWRQSPGATWTAVFTDGLGDASNVAVDYLIEFNGNLYAGTWNETAGGGSNGGQIWRSATGNPGDWQMVASGGFTSTNNGEVFRLAVFNNQIYAATWNPTTGGELWRSSSGDSGSWAPVATGGFSDVDNVAILSLAEFNGHLYAGTDNYAAGAEVWRSSTGNSGSWSQVNTSGFGDPYNYVVTLEALGGYLYAGTYNYPNSDNPGAELWRCQQCDGTDWQSVSIAKGFGDAENRSIRSLVVFDNVLYALTYNRTTGMEIWRTTDGINWGQVGPDGLGDSNNYAPYWDNSVAVLNNNLYIGTWNPANGGEVWMMLHQVYLPLVLRNY